MALPVVHPVVNERVDHRVGHGEPVEGQVHVLDVAAGCDGVVVVGVDEIAVVRQPAECKDGYHEDEHPDYLGQKEQLPKFTE